ncbi:hypothetical protein PFTANZ_06671 [Plasmodium falciparum Tanzania (2000708)]|uniref:Uncharacterized protein n=1 Tax=Plasmodium falciparum Tanzania (2000708) TaxID=1036725 RepID=A0A024VV43_PLAFA|nr:hypothetical protein PFTANZ_06671 [Plasmodium falciparum Tanzania (2000708)]
MTTTCVVSPRSSVYLTHRLQILFLKCTIGALKYDLS